MNPECPYCQCPERYDLEPAVIIKIDSKEKHGNLMGHLPKHPIACQPGFHIKCSSWNTETNE
jgi:hypothetical protein